MKYLYTLLLFLGSYINSHCQTNFQNDVLTNALNYVSIHLPEGVNNTKSGVFELNTTLSLKESVNVTAYFVYSGAKYHDSFGVNNQVVWTNVLNLKAGVSQNLGYYPSGTILNVFITADEDSIYNNRHVYYSNNSLNPDFNQHCAVFTPDVFGITNSPYIFLAFEDLYGGGDKDINDVVIALDIGTSNVKYIESVPEAGILSLLGLGLIVLLAKTYLTHSSE
jgi:Domain of unknown function (DUF4114)